MLEKIYYDYSNTENIYIYHINFENTENGYIGSTINPRERMLSHFSKLKNNKHSNPALQAAYNKHKNFNFEIIFKCNIQYRNKIEEWFINKSNYNSNYNIMINCKQPIVVYKENKKFNKTDILNIFNLANCGIQLNRISLFYNCSKELIKCILLKKQYKLESKEINFKKDNYEYFKKLNKEINSCINNKNIYMYDVNGNFINKFKSSLEINKKYKFNKNSINNALNRGIQLKGFLFYHEEKKFIKYKPNKFKNKIIVYNNDFNIVSEHDNMTDCAKHYDLNLNSINSNCNRLTKNKYNNYFVREKDQIKFNLKYNI